VEIQSIGFPALPNTRTATAGTFTLYYWNELLNPPRTMLTVALGDNDDVVNLSPGGIVMIGQILQIEQELVEVVAVTVGGSAVAVSRGAHGSTVSAHTAGTLIYPLDSRTEILPFGRDFFGSPASGSYAFTVHLPAVRVACGSLYLTNSRGNSLVSKRCATETLDYGLRTLQGGQINIQCAGWLAIEDAVSPPLLVDRSLTVRDISAVLQDAPVGGPVTLRIRQDDDEICRLVIESGSKISNVITGQGLPPLRSGSYLYLDVTELSQAADSMPGSDLTVTIRL
jgi:hypothetical protein